MIPETPDEELGIERGEVADRPDAVFREGGARLRSNAPEPRDRQRVEERGLVARRDDDQAIGLAQVRRDLRDELRGRDADGRGQPDLRPDGGLDRGAISGGEPKSASDPATSRNASSIETCSTRGV